jgi:hypothetical protein
MICGVEGKTHFFDLHLPHGDALFVVVNPAATAEAWLDDRAQALALFS